MSPAAGATLCVDAGTTLIKAVVFDPAGAELAVARRATVVSSPRPGHAEQDPVEVWDAVVGAVREAAAASPVPVRRVAVTAQGDGAWPVDADGSPTGPAVLWSDARARGVVERWRAQGVLEAAFAVNGSLTNAGLPNAVMVHALEGDPRALDGVGAVLTCGSWLFARMTGRVGLHPSDASAPWLDVATGTVSDALLELYGLSAHRALVPPVLDAGQVVQPLGAAAAEQLGLAAGTPVVLAPYDVVATAAGGGTVRPGSAFCILGTTLCTGVVAAAPDTTGPAAGLSLRVGDGPTVVRAFPTLAGTGVLDWLAALLGLPGAADVVALAEQVPAGSALPMIWPYLSPAGERAPFLDADACGVVAGLSFEHSRAHLARAAVEGLAHVVRDCLDATGVTPRELVVSGGGSASRLWCATIADVTGVTAVRASDSQVGAKGAMVHAAVATGEHASLADAVAALVVPADRFDPDPAAAAGHEQRHAEHVESRALLATRWSRWSGRDRRG